MASTGLTLLEGINQVLRAAGIFPVAVVPSTESDTTSDAALAEEMLDINRVRTLQRGWPDNTSYATRIAVGSGESTVTLDSDVLTVRGAGPDAGRNFGIQNQGLWDADAGSLTIRAIRAADDFVTLDLVKDGTFVELSTTLKDLIVAEASLEFARMMLSVSPAREQVLQHALAKAEYLATRNPARPSVEGPNSQPVIAQPQQGQQQRS